MRTAVRRLGHRLGGRPGRARSAARLRLLVQRLALWAAWLGVTATVFVAVDLYT